LIDGSALAVMSRLRPNRRRRKVFAGRAAMRGRWWEVAAAQMTPAAFAGIDVDIVSAGTTMNVG